jgi:hypothetical protein
MEKTNRSRALVVTAFVVLCSPGCCKDRSSFGPASKAALDAKDGRAEHRENAAQREKNGDQLAEALMHEDLATAIQLVEGGADLNAVYVSKSRAEYTPLMLVRESNIARLMISKGADVNKKTPTFEGTPLIAAAFRGDFEMGAALLRQRSCHAISII